MSAHRRKQSPDESEIEARPTKHNPRMAEGTLWQLYEDEDGDWAKFAVWRRTFVFAPEFFAAAPPQLVAGLLRRMFTGVEIVDEDFFIHCLSRAPPFWDGGEFVLTQPWGPTQTGAEAAWTVRIAICSHCRSAAGVLRALVKLERRGAPVAQIAEVLVQPSSDEILISEGRDGLDPGRGHLDRWTPKETRTKLIDYVPSEALEEAAERWRQEGIERPHGEEAREDAAAREWAVRRARGIVHWRGIRSAWVGAVVRAAKCRNKPR